MNRAPDLKASGRSLADFSGSGYDKGRALAVQALWFAIMNMVFSKWWCPARLRVILLRVFGAEIGQRVLIRHGVKVLWPWKLIVGSDSWIGEDVWILNLEPVVIGSDVCISQAVRLFTGSHRWDSPTFEYDNAPIRIEEGAWVAVGATILRGVTICRNATVPAGAVIRQDVPAESMAKM
jgi:putative colanic acid biosynthesis acetyltransferase WcaF